jgi:hypothetical protein
MFRGWSCRVSGLGLWLKDLEYSARGLGMRDNKF